MEIQIQNQEYSDEVLSKMSDLLTRNPEYYTIWNYRRRLLQDRFKSFSEPHSQIPAVIQSELEFLFPLLRQYPKCYWIWKYRLWLLEQANQLLPASTAKAFWNQELLLDNKMLSLDSRNFHGWGYRRIVISNLESSSLNDTTADPISLSLALSEFDYTTKMTKSNLSNFSAWHSRTKVQQRLLSEQKATHEERRKAFDSELDLIHRALFDPYDQSLWFYHQALMTSLDPDPRYRNESLVPDLSDEERLEYLDQEKEELREILEDAKDCKWIYLALVEIARLRGRVLRIQLEAVELADVQEWIGQLKVLDPLRLGRWKDLEDKVRG